MTIQVKLNAKFSKSIGALFILTTAAMFVANLFGAGIPWLFVVLPILVQLALMVLAFAVLGLLTIFVLALRSKAAKK